MLQSAVGVPSDSATTRSFPESVIKNNPIARRDKLISAEVLGCSKHTSQGKTTRTQHNAVSVATQQVDSIRTTRQFNSDVEL